MKENQNNMKRIQNLFHICFVLLDYQCLIKIFKILKLSYLLKKWAKIIRCVCTKQKEKYKILVQYLFAI